MAVMWRNVADPVVGEGRWIALEHELWSYANRNEEARRHLARRYRAVWDAVGEGVAEWVEGGDDIGPTLIGLLFGLEMMRRVDPDVLTDEMAIAALCGVVAASDRKATT